jgi:capsule polysaccharide export protein KpsE/RkpR
MKNNPTFTDYLSILFKWKKFLIINLIVVSVIATTISFIIPKTYKATASIILAPESSMGLGGLGGLISGNSTMSLGAKLFGMSATDEDLVLGLLNSRTIIEKVVNKFNLYDYYEEDERNFDKLIKKMSGDLSFEPNEYGMVEVSIISKNPIQSADVANYFVYLADSLNIELAIRNAKNNRAFVERRYQKNIEDLKMAEDSMYVFQKKYGIFAIPEQLEVSVKAASEIEAMLFQKELVLNMLKETKGESSFQYIDQLSEVKILRNKINELKYSDKLTSTSNIFFPFKKAPDIVIEYFRLFREVEIQSKIMEYTLPIFEQAKLDEQKSIPTLLTVDQAIPPQLKYGPKKAFIIISIFFISLFMLVIVVFRAEKIIHLDNFANIILKKESSFYNKLLKIYRMRIV